MRFILSLAIIGVTLISVPVAASSPSSSISVGQKPMRLSRRKLYLLSKRGHHGKKKHKHKEEEEKQKEEEKKENNSEGGKSDSKATSLLPGNSLQLPQLPQSILPNLPTFPALPQIPTLPNLFGGPAS